MAYHRKNFSSQPPARRRATTALLARPRPAARRSSRAVRAASAGHRRRSSRAPPQRLLHGLWPRYDPHRAVAGSAGARDAAWPEYCARSAPTSRRVAASRWAAATRCRPSASGRRRAGGRRRALRAARIGRRVQHERALAGDALGTRTATCVTSGPSTACTWWTAAVCGSRRCTGGSWWRRRAARRRERGRKRVVRRARPPGTRHRRGRLYAVGCRACRLTEIWFAAPPAPPSRPAASPEPDALLEAARLQILRGGRGAALCVWG